MAATNETYLPTYEELYVPPLNVTSAVLRAGAVYFGQYCDFQSKVCFFFLGFIFNFSRNFHLNLRFYLKRNLCFAKQKKTIRASVSNTTKN